MVNLWDFSGCDTSKFNSEREAAVDLGNKFFEKGLFKHCVGDHIFKDQPFFYIYLI
jgi:hypothetical protein